MTEENGTGREEFRQAAAVLDTNVAEREALWEVRHRFYSRWNGGIVGISLFLSAAVTIAGIFDEGIVAAVLGVLLGLTIGAQQAWPLSEKSYFYRSGKAEAYGLRRLLERRLLDQADLDDIRAKFLELNQRMEDTVPRGAAVHEVVQNMRDAVRNKTAD